MRKVVYQASANARPLLSAVLSAPSQHVLQPLHEPLPGGTTDRFAGRTECLCGRIRSRTREIDRPLRRRRRTSPRPCAMRRLWRLGGELRHVRAAEISFHGRAVRRAEHPFGALKTRSPVGVPAHRHAEATTIGVRHVFPAEEERFSVLRFTFRAGA